MQCIAAACATRMRRRQKEAQYVLGQVGQAPQAQLAAVNTRTGAQLRLRLRRSRIEPRRGGISGRNREAAGYARKSR